ncbi:PBSX family phage terminase large subunit [Aneurinibacillus aneurinilyticus]|uniref:PBSX family phage terminase large subunit n=1 Tax=Aneurinibacillus aneurinilyticus TaxID=1391 RepID=UPI0023EFEBA7|nr:PBSX family phage terminase large subunit [Aneurinibacillus aneurinilyticus]
MTTASKTYKAPSSESSKPSRSKRIKPAPFKWGPLSKKQLQVMTWWNVSSPVKDMDGIICDGSVRSGKTVSMSFSYVLWGMETFNDVDLGMAGKTIGSLRRNVVQPLKKILKARKNFKVKDRRSDNYLEITYKGRTNRFYLFGGKDESSQTLIQGMTLAGMFFDEVALMPESFVSQATMRCSITGSKYWFNCNPAGPFHWFKKEWLDKLKEKNIFHLHFTMDDNLSLEPKIKERYYRQYSGLYFKRFILGLWVLAEGTVYDMFDEEKHVVDSVPLGIRHHIIGVDFGTNNPTAFLLIGKYDGAYYVIKEYYYDGRSELKKNTVGTYSKVMKKFAPVDTPIYIDPSASPLIAQLEEDGIYPEQANNEVLNGIQTVAGLLEEGKLFVHQSCENLIREFSSYVWDEKAQKRGEDKPVKDNDHALDALRYAVHTDITDGETGFYVIDRPI